MVRNAFMFALAAATSAAALAQRNAPADAPFILEHSYWIAPGDTERFLELLNRNKMPLLRREIGAGRILWMRLTRPRLRTGDGTQPDVRLTIAWRSPQVAWDDVDPSRFAPSLYADPQSREREEKEREKLVLRRSDMPVQETLIDHE